MTDKILILDFGSQVTQLIARRVRENGVYCEIHSFTIADEKIRDFGPRGVILSGGPASVIAYGRQAMGAQVRRRVAVGECQDWGAEFEHEVGGARLFDGLWPK